MKTKTISIIVLIVLLFANLVFPAGKTAYAQAGTPELRLPYKAGSSFKVTCDAACHGKGRVGVVDFKMTEETVLAAHSGYIVLWPNAGTGGNIVDVCTNRSGDGFCTNYAHLSKFLVKEGQYVNQGDPIGISGNTGYRIENGKRISLKFHLHFGAFTKTGGKKGPISGVTIIFYEVGHELRNGEKPVSQNGASNPPPPPPPQDGYLTDSYLYINGSGDLTYNVCGVNLHQSLEVRAWRTGRLGYFDFGIRREWVDFGSQRTCATFSDLDGPGPVYHNVTYHAAVSRIPGQAGNICHSKDGLCDEISSP